MTLLQQHHITYHIDLTSSWLRAYKGGGVSLKRMVWHYTVCRPRAHLCMAFTKYRCISENWRFILDFLLRHPPSLPLFLWTITVSVSILLTYMGGVQK